MQATQARHPEERGTRVSKDARTGIQHMNQWVYAFGGGGADGDASMKNLLGGKGANLAEMSSLGLPLPPRLTITTEACVHYHSNERKYPAELDAQVAAGLKTVETLTSKAFGDPANPLLVSV